LSLGATAFDLVFLLEGAPSGSPRGSVPFCERVKR
jgi:hypothetical protein